MRVSHFRVSDPCQRIDDCSFAANVLATLLLLNSDGSDGYKIQKLACFTSIHDDSTKSDLCT